MGEVDGARQDAEPLAVRLAERRALSGQCRQQRGPRLRLAVADQAAAAVRVIEAEDFGLADRAGAAQAGGMRGIALDLDRPAVHVPDQDAVGVATARR